MGYDVLLPSVLSHIHDCLGEAGADLFESLLFPDSRLKQVLVAVRLRKLYWPMSTHFFAEQVSQSEYWAAWMKYLAVETYYSTVQSEDDSDSAATEENGEPHPQAEPEMHSTDALKDSKDAEDFNVGWFEHLHARFSSTRRLKHLFFEEQIVVQYHNLSLACFGYSPKMFLF